MTIKWTQHDIDTARSRAELAASVDAVTFTSLLDALDNLEYVEERVKILSKKRMNEMLANGEQFDLDTGGDV